jgi:CO/xanthine dehydrogenase FAD-binding subunit
MSRAYMNLSIVLSATDDGNVADLRIVPGAVEAVARRVTAAEKILLGKKVEKNLIDKATEILADEMVGVWIPDYKMPVLRNVFKRVLSSVL